MMSRSGWTPSTILPQGAGPILYIKDFGDTSALMLTVASPPADPGSGRLGEQVGRGSVFGGFGVIYLRNLGPVSR